MKFRHAAALALVGWYLMIAPILPRVVYAYQAIHADTAAPLSRWTILGTFPTQKECEA
jgi:hypothetical protein